MTISANTPARVAVLLTVIAVALVLLLAGTVAALAGGDTSTAPAPGAVASETLSDAGGQATHLVRSGDTLWDIATAHTEPGDDVRDTLLDIKRANGLSTSMITPGQLLVIP
jgi:nucleoid-associated protein YgaU